MRQGGRRYRTAALRSWKTRNAPVPLRTSPNVLAGWSTLKARRRGKADWTRDGAEPTAAPLHLSGGWLRPGVLPARHARRPPAGLGTARELPKARTGHPPRPPAEADGAALAGPVGGGRGAVRPEGPPAGPAPRSPVRIWRRGGSSAGARGAQAQDGLCPGAGGAERGGPPVEGQPAGARPRPRHRRRPAPRFHAGPRSRVPAGAGKAERKRSRTAAPGWARGAGSGRSPGGGEARGLLAPLGQRPPPAQPLAAFPWLLLSCPSRPRLRGSEQEWKSLSLPKPCRKTSFAVDVTCPSCSTRY